MNLTLVVLCEQKEMKQLDVGVVQEEKMELELKLEEEKKFRQEQESKITRLTELICVSSRSTGQTPKVENKVRKWVTSTPPEEVMCVSRSSTGQTPTVENKVRKWVTSTPPAQVICVSSRSAGQTPQSGEQSKEMGEKHVFPNSFV